VDAQVIEGTWKEVLPRISEFAGRKFRIHALSEESEISHEAMTFAPEEIICALDELAEMNRDLPVLSPDAFERESIYEDEI
jgi:hypothetical protein